MDKPDKIAVLVEEMAAYEAGCPYRVHHFLKVLGFARTIAALEGLPLDTAFTLEAAAVVHDIGIRPSLEKHGNADGPNQEQEGPPAARPMLERLGFEPPVVDRVCHLVSRHHTYTGIDGPDYQILVEADFLVNLHEGDCTREKAESICRTIFKTEAGRRLCRLMYLEGAG